MKPETNLVSITIENNLIKATLEVSGPDKETLLTAAKEYDSKIRKIYAANPNENYKILIDIRKISQNMFTLPHEAADAMDSVNQDIQTIKIAILGNSRLQEVVTDILFVNSRYRNSKFFTDEETAKLWLKN